jgi:hypothetical protein
LLLKDGEQTVRRSAGDEFERARLHQLAKSGKQIAFSFINEETTTLREEVEIEAGQLSQFWMIPISPSLALGEIDQQIQVSHIALAQEFVPQHGAESRRDRHCEFEWHAIAH